MTTWDEALEAIRLEIEEAEKLKAERDQKIHELKQAEQEKGVD